MNDALTTTAIWEGRMRGGASTGWFIERRTRTGYPANHPDREHFALLGPDGSSRSYRDTLPSAKSAACKWVQVDHWVFQPS